MMGIYFRTCLAYRFLAPILLLPIVGGCLMDSGRRIAELPIAAARQ
jgi:hypothetical protein